MKKILRITLIVVLAVLLVGMLVACSGLGLEYKLPSTVDGSGSGDGTQTETELGTPAYMSFSYLRQSPSVFKHIYIDEFNLEDILYHVAYTVPGSNGQYTVAEEGTPLTVDMVEPSSRAYLTRAGHHMIHCAVTLQDGTEIEGSFVLHLKERVEAEPVTLTFNPQGGKVQFGQISNNIATIKVARGSVYSWGEFISLFPVSHDSYALSSWRATNSSGSATYTSSSTEIVVDSDTTFTAGWTENIIQVNFDLNLPADITNWTPAVGNTLPDGAENGTWAINVEKNNGVIARPAVEDFATFGGYTFAGWFYETDDGLAVWNFNSKVGSQDMSLKAVWTKRTYSITYVLMGGVFDETDNLTDVSNLTDVELYVRYNNGLTEDDPNYDPNYTQNLRTNLPFALIFSGVEYSSALSGYYASCESVRNSGTIINVSADPTILATQLEKGDNYYTFAGWYTSSSYRDDERFEGTVADEDYTLYAKWDINNNLSNTELNSYYADYLFAYTTKSDGTLRIDKIKDTSISSLVIPNTISVGNLNYRVTEIGDEAAMNLKSLITLDLTNATSLTTIGAKSFDGCPNLRYINVAEDGSNVSYVGENAFAHSEWLADFESAYDTSPGTATPFVSLGSVLIKFVGDPEVTSIDISQTAFKSIAPQAFRGLPALTNVTLGDKIENVYSRAFYNCLELQIVDAGSALRYVESDALENTKYLNTRPQDDPATETVDESTFLRLGKIFYRFMGGPVATTAVIPADIEIIAPNAFLGAQNVATIDFLDSTKIKEIGNGAFSSTAWITNSSLQINEGTYISDGFVVINYILVSYTGRASVVEIPSTVKTIAARAFSGMNNARISNIVIPAGDLVEIKSQAFYGATELVAISFLSMTDSALVNIETDSFSGRTGELVNANLKIYLYKTPLSTLEKPIAEADDYLVWKELRANHDGLFNILATNSAVINSAVVPTKYLRAQQDVDFYEVWHASGLLNDNGDEIVNGVKVLRSDGIEIIENLALNNINAISGAAGSHNIGFTVGGGINAGGEDVPVKGEDYAYNVYNAIKADSIKVWRTEGENSVNTLPTFYTTQKTMPLDDLWVEVAYDDGEAVNQVGYIELSDPMISIEGYRAMRGRANLTILINYHNLATYSIVVAYRVEEPSVISIEQTTSLTVPINSVARNHFGSVSILLKRNDGTESTVSLNSAGFSVISRADAIDRNHTADTVTMQTSTLGYHYAGLRYGNVTSGYVFAELIYSVILVTDASVFSYRIIDAEAQTAAITGIRESYDTTIAIPSTANLASTGVYTTFEGKPYTIVEIANDAFENKTRLEYVYIPTSVTKLGDRAFKGCTALRQVRSFEVKGASVDQLELTDVKSLNQRAELTADITVTGLSNLSTPEVVVPETVTYSTLRAGEGKDGVDVSVTYTATLKLEANAFYGYYGKVYLLDTPENETYATNNLQYQIENNLLFYYTADQDIITSEIADFTFSNFDHPILTGGTIFGEVEINPGVNLSTDADGSLVIPEILTGTSKIEATDTVTFDYEFTIAAIANAAFTNVSGLRTIYLPNSIRRLGGDKDGVFGEDSPVKIYVYDVRESAVYAPSNYFSHNVKEIGRECFRECISLGIAPEGVSSDEVTLAEYNIDFSQATSLEFIGVSAFYGCLGVIELDFSQSKIVEIAEYAFMDCRNLVTLKLPTTIKVFGNNAFYNCTNLSSASGAYALEFIGSYAFYNCQSLETIAIPVTVMPGNIASNAFDSSPNLKLVWIFSREFANEITIDNCGNLIQDAEIVFLISTAKVDNPAFLDEFTAVSGTVKGETVMLGGEAVMANGLKVTWADENGTVKVDCRTVTEDGYIGITNCTMQAYVRK